MVSVGCKRQNGLLSSKNWDFEAASLAVQTHRMWIRPMGPAGPSAEVHGGKISIVGKDHFSG